MNLARRLRPLDSVAAMVLLALTAIPAAAQPQSGGAPMMPDPRQMSGIPLPVSDVAAGSVTVRLIRGSLANPIANHEVVLEGTQPRRATTNEAGRAEFTGLAPGTRVKAVAVVDGERLESQAFELPPAAGIRVMLVAADPGAGRGGTAPPAAPAPEGGAVVLGDQSRFVFEFGDDGMSVFNILQIQNTTTSPVATSEPLVFELPAEAESPGLLEGSSPQARLAGKEVVVAGPFAPGATLVQFAYSIPYSGDTLNVVQRLPAALTRLTVLAQKVGETHLTSPQMSDHREMNAEGQTYIVGQGPAVAAGGVVNFSFTGLPHTPLWPRNVALAVALAILVAGAWGSMHRGAAPAAVLSRRRQLEERRDGLFSDLTALEERHRAGQEDAERYASKRRQLVSALERIYAELDEEAVA